MHTVSLGTDGPPVTKIGLGCWQFSGGVGGAGSYWPALPEEETNAIVSAALAGGINWFDTAESYGRGRSELALAQALRHAGGRERPGADRHEVAPMGPSGALDHEHDRRADSLSLAVRDRSAPDPHATRRVREGGGEDAGNGRPGGAWQDSARRRVELLGGMDPPVRRPAAAARRASCRQSG